MKRWYCVQAKARQEFFAVKQLRQNGFKPLLITDVVEHRSPGSKSKSAGTSTISLFGSYFFVPFDVETDHWRRIAYTYGVKRILGASPEAPSPIPDSTIESLLVSRLTPAHDISLTPQIHPECKARVISGPLAADTTIGICKWRKQDRVGMLLDIMNGTILVEFHISALELIP